MVVTSVLVLFGLGFTAAVILSVASRLLYVEEDPRVEAVNEALPGANCGGCGYAGCEGYAIAVVTDPAIPANLCCAGGPEVSAAVGQLTGKDAGAADPEVSYRRCAKDDGQVKARFDYQGVPTCAGAAMMGGQDECSYSCMGFGDCVRACPFGAMEIRDGMVRISKSLCTGCGVCIKTCPNEILELVPVTGRVNVMCSSLDKGKAVMSVCKTGCISCMKCVKACPAKAVALKKGRIYIDHAKCIEFGSECFEACVDSCPRDILRAIAPRTPKPAEAPAEAAEAKAEAKG